MAVNMAAPQRRRSVSSESELPDYYRPLSLALYQIMEDVGANAEMRNMWQERFATSEILWTIALGPEWHNYIFGSSREGTSIVDMNPDTDSVFIDNRFPVITDCSAVSGQESLLLVHDNDTQAGYAKLQLVYNGVPLFQNCNGILNVMHFDLPLLSDHCADKNNRLVIAFNPEKLRVIKFERHGPALFLGNSFGFNTMDIVCAFNVSSLPSCVEEWINRTRNYNWPPVDVIDHCKTLGCLLVPVGHPHSDEQHLEWRLSFSHQERLLVSQFNSVQHKCYILMKLWKKDVLPLWIRPESFSSYHCKTCMFYMIENTPSDFWRPDNLLGCFVACLKLFLFWTTNGILPNYFIPAENMFDRRINRQLQYDLQQALQNMLTQDCKYLTQISTSIIGDRLLACVTMPSLYRQHLSFYINSKLMSELQTLGPYYYSGHFCIQRCFSNSSRQWLININNFSQSLKHTTRITKHTEEETQRALSYIVPYLDQQLFPSMVALAKQQGRSGEEIRRALFSDTWNQLSPSDSSAKLKQASLMYMFGYYDASLDVLLSIDLRDVHSLCTCNDIPDITSVATLCKVRSVLNQPGVTTEIMLRRLIVSCIVFLPTERSVTPDALCYEMLRYLDDPLGNADGLTFNYLRECAVVDGPFLFHFLLYLNHSKVNMSSHIRVDIDNMNYTVNARDVANLPKCSHREACLNILGWVYKDQGCVETAVQCFRRSLEVKRRGNSATWHLRDLLNTSQ